MIITGEMTEVEVVDDVYVKYVQGLWEPAGGIKDELQGGGRISARSKG